MELHIVIILPMSGETVNGIFFFFIIIYLLHDDNNITSLSRSGRRIYDAMMLCWVVAVALETQIRKRFLHWKAPPTFHE